MKLLLYCTKGKEILWWNKKFDKGYQFFMDGRYNRLLDECPDFLLNGKIVAECDFDVEELELKMDYKYIMYMGLYYCGQTVSGWDGSLCEESRLDNWQLLDYLGDKVGNKGYAIHIKNLHIFDRPKELSNYGLEKAPQNMMRVEPYGLAPFILISIHPEWLCKILNGEKTIEVRKKVLKEML